MARKTSITSLLFRAARTSADVRSVERTLQTGSPKPVERRLKNKLIGRALGKAGIWRMLWR